MLFLIVHFYSALAEKQSLSGSDDDRSSVDDTSTNSSRQGGAITGKWHCHQTIHVGKQSLPAAEDKQLSNLASKLSN